MDTLPPVGPAKKSSNRGCLIALAIVAGVGLLVVAIAGFAVYSVVQSPEGQKIMGAVGEAVSMAQDGMKAPGTAELRGLGCGTAIVIDASRVAKLTEPFGENAQVENPVDGLDKLVTCQLGTFSKERITCDDVARTYLAAVGATKGRFLVSVESNGDQSCAVVYEPDGTSLGPVDTTP